MKKLKLIDSFKAVFPNLLSFKSRSIANFQITSKILYFSPRLVQDLSKTCPRLVRFFSKNHTGLLISKV